jgi:hypothetical protein
MSELLEQALRRYSALESECRDLIEEAHRRKRDNGLGDAAYRHAVVRLEQFLKTGESSFFSGKEKPAEDQNSTFRKRVEIQGKRAVLNMDEAINQMECGHPNATRTLRPGKLDCSWFDCSCPDCGMWWSQAVINTATTKKE